MGVPSQDAGQRRAKVRHLAPSNTVDTIVSGRTLSLEQQRAVAAALALRGLTQQEFATREQLSYSRLLRMVRGTEALTPRYAEALGSLVRVHLVKPVRSRAFAA